MKKRQGKKIFYCCNRPLEFEDPFKNSWCPLFGQIPWIEDAQDHPILTRCIEIIIKARELWEVPNVMHPLEIQFGNPNKKQHIKIKSFWPDIKELVNCFPDYPSEAIQAARACYSNFLSIVQHSEHYANIDTLTGINLSNDPWYENDKEILHFARKGIGMPDGKGSDGAIFAVLSIIQAWHVMRDVLYYHVPENDKDILRNLEIANLLLGKSEKIKEQDVLSDLEKADRRIDIMKPLAMRGQQRQKQEKAWSILGATSSKNEADKYRIQWLKAAKAIRIKHPDKKKYTIRRIADEIKNSSLEPQQSFQTIYKYLLKNRV